MDLNNFIDDKRTGDMCSFPLLRLPEEVLVTTDQYNERPCTTYGSMCSPATPSISDVRTYVPHIDNLLEFETGEIACEPRTSVSNEQLSILRARLLRESVSWVSDTGFEKAVRDLGTCSGQGRSLRSSSKALVFHDDMLGVEIACVRTALDINGRVFYSVLYGTLRGVTHIFCEAVRFLCTFLRS